MHGRPWICSPPPLRSSPDNSASWYGYARAALAVDPGNNWDERIKLQERQATAAYAAYQRAATPADEATALALLGEVYAAQKDVASISQRLCGEPQGSGRSNVRSTYEQLREEHGFRITDFKVDSDCGLSPRLLPVLGSARRPGRWISRPMWPSRAMPMRPCRPRGSSFASMGSSIANATPSCCGRACRRPWARACSNPRITRSMFATARPKTRFTGRNYVLPSTGQEGIPVVSVNTAKVDVEVYRIGDRNLLPTVRSYDFLGQLTRSSAAEIARDKGFKIWNGTLDTRIRLSIGTWSRLSPSWRRSGKLEPGVYVMTAKPHDGTAIDNESADDWNNIATQWFVVSDLGLTAFTGKGGVQVFVRSLASAEPRADVEVRLIARNNEVLATKKTDAMGVATFDPGLARGEGGLAPGLVVATEGVDYGFLDLGTAAFDLTDRGVKGRAVSGAIDAYLYTERGVYRTGETVALTALLRDGKGAAVPGLPLTIVVRRPTASNIVAIWSQDQGLGGRALSIPILPGSLRGTWRVAAYTDPKGSSVGDGQLPGRRLCARAAGTDPDAEGGRPAARYSRLPSTWRRAISTALRGSDSRRHRRGFGRRHLRPAASRG